MTEVALLIKTFSRDSGYVRRLLDSVRTYNTESLPVHLIVPKDDLSEFSSLTEKGMHLHTDEDVAGRYLVSEFAHGLSPGYLNQEIVKLAFAETGLAANYFCVDSDAVFIRPFSGSDFLRRPGEPYSVLVQDKELEVEPKYYRDHWRGRMEAIRRIMDFVGLDDPIVRTCHGHQVFSSVVIRSFVEEFLQPRGWTFTDAIREVPYEFSWYNMWLQKSQVIPVHPIEPLVKVFHNEDQHLDYLLRGIGLEDLARAYLAVVVNSNYSRDLGEVNAGGDKFSLVGGYLSYAELLSVIGSKARDTFRRRLGG